MVEPKEVVHKYLNDFQPTLKAWLPLSIGVRSLYRGNIAQRSFVCSKWLYRRIAFKELGYVQRNTVHRKQAAFFTRMVLELSLLVTGQRSI